MNILNTYEKLEELGRVRLSKNFFMRDFLYSEIAAWHGIRNIPENPERAIHTGRMLCENLLEPLQSTFGRIHIRSGYRSPQVNEYGNHHNLNCASNEKNFGRHIWDYPDAQGRCGAMACIVVPWLVDYMEKGGSWTALAWWIHDHLPYSSLHFFSKLGAFNIGWHEQPERRIDSFAAPKGCLTQRGMSNHGGSHADQYKGFPAFLSAPTAEPSQSVYVASPVKFASVSELSAPTTKPAASPSPIGVSFPLAVAPQVRASNGAKVNYRAVHTKTKWRKANNHGSLDSALSGPNGATALFAGKVRIDYTKHGEPMYVLVWQEGANSGYAVKRNASASNGVKTVSVPMDALLRFEAQGQASQTELERYF